MPALKSVEAVGKATKSDGQKLTTKVLANRLMKAARDSCLARRVEGIGARLTGRVPAAGRFAAFRARLRAKLPAVEVSVAEVG